MNNGKFVILGVLGCVVAGGLWMRSVAVTEWDLTQRFYRQHRATFARFDALHAAVRSLKVHPAHHPEDVAAEARALAAEVQGERVPNGRTSRTQEAEVAYATQAAAWARELARNHLEAPSASPSFLDLEVAYGALVGQVQLSDRAYTFKVPGAPGTMPTPTPKRII